MENFMQKYNVSRETYDKLKLYQQLLSEWQQKFNLVSKSTLDNSWQRHFEDSAQLFKYIPKNAKILYDFGSGAGFPGMVLAIMSGDKTPYLKICLVESVGKKTLYLNEVKQKTNTSVEILNQRIENLKPQKADVITSRALTALKDLLNYAYPFCKSETLCIFPKGRRYCEELQDARRYWNFDCRVEDSTTDSDGKILLITNLSKIKGEK